MKPSYTDLMWSFCMAMMVATSFFPCLAFSGQPPSTSPITPEKPEEMLLRLLFYPLAGRVGTFWALIILILFAALVGFFAKEIPKLVKWFIASIFRKIARLLQYNTREYRAWVIQEHKKVRVGYKDFDIDIKQDYVSLLIRTGKSDIDMTLQDVPEVLRQNQYLVVRGHPGAGKTTLLKYLTIKYAAREMKMLHGKHLIPIFVPLKDAVASSDLFEYLARIFDRHFKDGKAYLRRQLEKGNCIIFLDSIDEAYQYRDKVLKWIDDFRAEYKKNHLVITLRKEGYENIRFSAQFNDAEVADLTVPQMENLARNVLRAKFPGETATSEQQNLMEIIRGR